MMVTVTYISYKVPSQDKLFTSDLWNNLLEIAGAKLKMNAPSRPQADGPTEGMNRNFVNLLSKITSNRLDWGIEIKLIEFAINTTVNSSTGHTPFSILLDCIHPNINTDYNLPYLEAARENVVDAQITMALQYNKNRDDFKFEVGNIVLVKREKVNIAMLNDKDQSKVLPNYYGRRIFKSSDSNYKPLEEIEKIVYKRNRVIGRGSRIEYIGKIVDHDMWLPLFALNKCGKFIKAYEDTYIV
ncbi:hypothetical protein ACTFIR_007585 [Dictyostelium discoideum]